MFTAKWKKDARHLVKAARKFVHYKRDLLPPDRLSEIESRRDDLRSAVRQGDREKAAETSKQLHAICENALPHHKPLNWLEENVEVMFVAVVVALGLRAYYLQPFRIPTGSMQPTLNGIIGRPLSASEWPSWPQRLMEAVLRGRSYVKVINDKDRRIALVRRGPGGPLDFDVRDVQVMHFFSRGEIHFLDAPPMRLPAPRNPSLDAGLREALQTAYRNGGVLPAGTTVCEGIVDTGDLVLVDKFSYHFRKPRRGEVFVFDTVGIKGIHERSGDQAAGSHYIKRLCGVPGDSLSIAPPNLLIDGRMPDETEIRRVAEGRGEYSLNAGGYGYAGKEGGPRPLVQHLAGPDDTLKLRGEARPGMREYAALGDNTGNSLDSRYWGTVKEFNLVGPAMVSLWPVTTGHWGFIR